MLWASGLVWLSAGRVESLGPSASVTLRPGLDAVIHVLLTKLGPSI